MLEKKKQSKHLTQCSLSHCIVSYHFEQMTVFFEKNSLWISNRIIFQMKIIKFAFRSLVHSHQNEDEKKLRSCKNKTSTAIQLLWPSACLATVNFLFVWSVFFHNSRTPLFTQFPGKFPTFRLIIRKALLFYLPMLLLIFFEFFFFIRRIVCYIIRVNRYISKLNVNVSLENTLAQCSFTNDLKIRFSTCDMVYEA